MYRILIGLGCTSLWCLYMLLSILTVFCHNHLLSICLWLICFKKLIKGLREIRSCGHGPDGGPVGGQLSSGNKSLYVGMASSEYRDMDLGDDNKASWSERVEYFDKVMYELVETRRRLHEELMDEIEIDGHSVEQSELVHTGHDNRENDLLNEGKGEGNSEGHSKGDSEGDSEDEVLVDEGDDESDYEDEDLEDGLGQNGPIIEGRGSISIGSDGRTLFEVSTSYANKQELVAAINNYAINMWVKLKLKKS